MKRSIESSDSEVNQSKDVLSLDKKTKKAMKKKSKKLDSDDEEAEEFTTSTKVPPPHSEPKRTRKSQGRGRFNDDDADLKLALELSLAETNQNNATNIIAAADEETSEKNTASNEKEVDIALNVSKQDLEQDSLVQEAKIEHNETDSKKNKKSPNSAAKKSNKKQKKEINNSDLSNNSDDDFDNKKKKSNSVKKQPKEPKKAKEPKEPKKAKEPKSAKKKTPASNKKKVLSDLEDDKPDEQENKENTFKKSLDFSEQKQTIPVEAQIKHVEPIEEKEDEEEQVKKVVNEEEELDEEVPKVEIVKASKILALNQTSNISSKTNVNSKFNSPAINQAIEQGRAEAKLTPTIVRIGLSRNSKIKSLHPNAKPTF